MRNIDNGRSQMAPAAFCGSGECAQCRRLVWQHEGERD